MSYTKLVQRTKSKKTENIPSNYTSGIQVKFAKKTIYGDLATLLFHWGKRISIRYKAADIVMLYLVYVNVKYHHIPIQKQISKCSET